MDARTFLDNFATIADASGGIARLRSLVLDLAVSGRLVEQSDDGDPTRAGLKAVRAEKGTTLAESIRGGGSIPRVPGPDERGEGLPPRWEWARLDDTGEYINGLAFKNSDWKPTGIPIVRIQNLTNPSMTFNYADGPFPDDRMAHDGDILVSWSATLNAFRWSRGEAVVNQHIFKVIPDHRIVTANFLFHLLRHSIRAMATSEAAHGLVMKHINRGPFLSYVVALPPLAEQERIVAKVDELMGLCDELEARHKRRHRAATRFRGSALGALAGAETLEALRIAWSRIDDNWSLLVDGAPCVNYLRQAIRQLAIRGWLTGNSRRATAARVRDVASLQNGYAFKSEWYTKAGVRLLRCQNIGIGELSWEDTRFITEEQSREFSRFDLELGDIVLALDRPLISTGLKVARLAERDLPCLLLQRVARIVPTADLDSEFLWLWLHSQSFIGAIDPGRSNGVPHISTKEVASIELRVPSLDMQRHAVRTSTKLLALCDSLEQSLKKAESGQAATAASATSTTWWDSKVARL